MAKGKIRIGTSNATVPGNKTTFPPAFQNKSRLHYYSSIFNTVEVNSCFYKTPQRSTYEKWSLDVPEDFQFSLKLSKQVTHTKELEDDLSCMENFFQTAAGAGNKKGCLLIQLPGKISLDYFEKVERILQTVEDHDPDHQWKKAVEFRNPSWYTGETNELLNEFDAAMVLHDHPKGKIAEPGYQAPFIYQRFHGPTGNYRDSYSESFLEAKAVQIKEWQEEGKDVYVYFNNTAGSAYDNAIYMQKLLQDED
jgi:uncharacterized protein YecE (DUF72 family)